jgi:hypothetical protein
LNVNIVNVVVPGFVGAEVEHADRAIVAAAPIATRPSRRERFTSSSLMIAPGDRLAHLVRYRERRESSANSLTGGSSD